MGWLTRSVRWLFRAVGIDTLEAWEVHEPEAVDTVWLESLRDKFVAFIVGARLQGDIRVRVRVSFHESFGFS
jgi:hypothetical protein